MTHRPLRALGPLAPDEPQPPSLTPTGLNAQKYPPPPCVTFRRVVVSLWGPGQSPVLPFVCCVGSLLSVGRCGRCSCWCRCRIRGAQWLVCWGCAGCAPLGQARPRSQKSGQNGGSTPTLCLDKAVHARDTRDRMEKYKSGKMEQWKNGGKSVQTQKHMQCCGLYAGIREIGTMCMDRAGKDPCKSRKTIKKNGKKFTSRTSRLEKWKNAH